MRNTLILLFGLVSSRIQPTGKAGTFQFTGQLTIKKTTLPVIIPFSVTAEGATLNFKGSFSIRRKDFDVGGTSTISNELTVSLNVIATK